LAEKVETDLIQLKKRRQSNEKVSSCLKFCCVMLNIQLIANKFCVVYDETNVALEATSP